MRGYPVNITPFAAFHQWHVAKNEPPTDLVEKGRKKFPKSECLCDMKWRVYLRRRRLSLRSKKCPHEYARLVFDGHTYVFATMTTGNESWSSRYLHLVFNWIPSNWFGSATRKWIFLDLKSSRDIDRESFSNATRDSCLNEDQLPLETKPQEFESSYPVKLLVPQPLRHSVHCLFDSQCNIL